MIEPTTPASPTPSEDHDWTPWTPEKLKRVNDDMAHGCMEMIREVLSAMECCHGKDHGATPGMAYPEWIMCIVKAAKAEAAVDAWEIGRKAGRREGMGMMDPNRPHPSPQNPYLMHPYTKEAP